MLICHLSVRPLAAWWHEAQVGLTAISCMQKFVIVIESVDRNVLPVQGERYRAIKNQQDHDDAQLHAGRMRLVLIYRYLPPHAACIMLGNILKQTKEMNGSISDTTYKTYNPLLALYSTIGILQTLFGAFVAVVLMGKLPVV